MKDKDIRTYQTFTRVRDFGAQHADSFARTSMSAQKFAELDAIIAELDEHGTVQASVKSMTRANTGGKKEARAELRARMEAISRTARRIPAEASGGQNNFRLPYNNSDRELINTARAFARDAEPIKAEFIKRELSETFIEDLNRAIDNFEQACNSKNLSESRRIAATAAIGDATNRGLNVVRDLDPLIRNKFRDNPATLTEWESARHVERAPRAKKKVEAVEKKA